MNPISHATRTSNSKQVNSKTNTYSKKLGTSNNIFASDDPADKGFMGESPAKKKATFNEFQKSTNIFGGSSDKQVVDPNANARKYTNTKTSEIVGNCPVDH